MSLRQRGKVQALLRSGLAQSFLVTRFVKIEQSRYHARTPLADSCILTRMLDAQRIVRAILNARQAQREPNDQEVGMVQVVLDGESSPSNLSGLLDALDDSSRFDFSVEFGLTGHLTNVVQEIGDEELEAFAERWAPDKE